MERGSHTRLPDQTIDPQREILLVFTALCGLYPSCRGRLAVCYQGPLAGAAALAVTGLGGASLLLAEAGQQPPDNLVRATDFTVSSLTEALRIVKNELRKSMPVSVSLRGMPAEHIAQMVERGLAPDLLCAPSGGVPPLEPFLRKGTVLLELPVLPPPMAGCSIRIDGAASLAERRQQDKHLREVFATEARLPGLAQTVNARWLTVASKLFPRERNRYFWGAE